MNKYANRVTTTARDVGSFIVWYGPHGIGKTTVACQAKQSVLVEVRDRSIDALIKNGVLPPGVPNVAAEDWSDLLGFLDYVLEGESGYKTVIIDGASGAEKYCDEETVKVDFRGDTEKFLAYGKGVEASALRWQDLLLKIEKLKLAGITTFLIAHKGTFEVKNADGANYFKWQPALNDKKFVQTARYCDAILRMDHDVTVKDVNKINGKGKASGASDRVLFCDGTPSFEAKNRLNLPPVIELGNSHSEAWQAFCQALVEGKKKGAK